MLDFLMYIFENYVDSGAQFTPSHELLSSHLTEAGFKPEEIQRVSEWLEGLAALQATNQRHRPNGGYATRVYTAWECRKLSVGCRSFLLMLELAGVLAPASRELVIERAMGFSGEKLTLEQLKWVVVLVLFHKPKQVAAIGGIENFAAYKIQAVLH